MISKVSCCVTLQFTEMWKCFNIYLEYIKSFPNAFRVSLLRLLITSTQYKFFIIQTLVIKCLALQNCVFVQLHWPMRVDVCMPVTASDVLKVLRCVCARVCVLYLTSKYLDKDKSESVGYHETKNETKKWDVNRKENVKHVVKEEIPLSLLVCFSFRSCHPKNGYVNCFFFVLFFCFFLVDEGELYCSVNHSLPGGGRFARSKS